jgi:hypothetical protein
MTVRQLLGSLDSRELTEWQLYEREVGTLGPERLDILVAKLAATIVRVNTEPKKQDQVKESDFLIKWSGGGADIDGDD